MNQTEKTHGARPSPLRGFWINPEWLTDVIDPEAKVAGFRSDLRLPAMPEHAVVRISAFDNYCLWINGRTVARGPARSTERNKHYDEIDITAFLKPGRNPVAAAVTAPTPGASRCGRRAFWCDFAIRFPSGRYFRAATDDSWKSCFLREYENYRLPLSSTLGWQEHLDLRKETDGWKECRTEELPAIWHAAWVVGPVNWTPPWRKMVRRATRMPEISEVCPKPVWFGAGPPEMPSPGCNLARRFNALALQKRALPGISSEGVRLHAGEVIAFDLGCVRIAVPEVIAETDSERLRLECYWDIRMGERPRATADDETAVGGLCDTVRLRRGRNAFTPLTTRGCRFWTLRLAGEGACCLRIAVRTQTYPFCDNGATFRSEDPLWQHLWEIGRNTLRIGTMDVSVDTVWREQALWTLDAAVSGPAAFFSFGDLAVWRRSLELIAESVDADGIAPAVALQRPTHAILFDQTMSWVESAAEYYLISGDSRSVRAWFPAMERFLRRCRASLTDDDLFIPPAYSWHFVDWGELNRRPYALAVNALLYSACRQADFLAGQLQVRSCAGEMCRRLIHGLRKFPLLSSGALADHLPCRRAVRTMTHNRNLSEADSPPLHGNAVLLSAGYFDADTAPRVAEFLCRALAESSDRHYSPAWIERLLRPLFRCGRDDAALAELRRKTASVQGSDIHTFGEFFPFEHYNSAHSWGAQINTILTCGLWGLRIQKPGCAALDALPSPLLADGRYELETPAGRLRLIRENGRVSSDSDMPVRILSR